VIRGLAELGRLGETTFAVDLSPERVELAKLAADGVRQIVADAANVASLPDGALDGVIASQVIEHVPDDRALVSEIARLLRPGGWWYVGTVLRGRWAFWFYRVDGIRRLDPTHVREYASAADLRNVLSHEELSIERVRTESLRYSVSDLVLRALGRVGIVGTTYLRNAYSSTIPEKLRRLRVPVPGYSLNEMSGHKRPAS
jgi:SAM-dependent methyltransferase